MSIKAQYPGLCRICGERYQVGDHIGRWLGHEAHFSCRQALIAQRAAEGDREDLPEARGWADRPSRTYVRGKQRQANLGAVRIQDGRSQDGRFQSKPGQ